MKRILATILCLAPMPVLADGPIVGLATCNAEHAIYELTGRGPDVDDVWRISFFPTQERVSIASDLYLRLTTTQRHYWFTFSVSQGYSGISVFPVTDPSIKGGGRDLLGPPFGDNLEAGVEDDVLGTLRFISLDSDLRAFYEPPVAGEEAPPYIMLPDLGLSLWYYTDALTDEPFAERDPMPRGAFRLADCLVAPNPSVNPGRAD